MRLMHGIGPSENTHNACWTVLRRATIAKTPARVCVVVVGLPTAQVYLSTLKVESDVSARLLSICLGTWEM